MARILWSDEAELSLLEMPSRDAVEHLASTRRGFVRDMLDGAGTLGLYVGAYVVLFVREGETINVLRVRTRR